MTGKRLRKIAQRPTTLQERRPFERVALHHETFERRQHSKEHKEFAGGMIAETGKMPSEELMRRFINAEYYLAQSELKDDMND